VLTPFGAIYRYEDYDDCLHFNLESELRAFVETKLRERADQ
jgi:hypothetical protein